jgi:mRNA-degrading endonuclease RelE of RelBE toxin-antitoxin system
MFYPVELTKVAEDSYDRFHAKAQVYEDGGRPAHPAVNRFIAVQNAIENVLPLDPCRPERALAGVLSYIYVLRLGSVTITYTVNEGKPAVIVQTISRAVRNDSMRNWLCTGIESGELVPVLESLGIQPYLARMEVNGLH